MNASDQSLQNGVNCKLAICKLADRLEPLAKSYESASALAREMGVSEGTIRKWAKGASEPRTSELVRLAQLLNVNLLWLATGEGPMRGERVESSRGCAAVDADALAKALTLVEQVGPGLPLDRKVKVTAAIYALFVQEGRVLDAQAIRQVVESLVI